MTKSYKSKKTNTLIKIGIITSLLILIPFQGNAQIFEKLTKKTEKKLEREVEDRTQKQIDDQIEKGLDKAEGEVEGTSKKENESKNTSDVGIEKDLENQDSEATKDALLTWSKFDFISGDIVIFEDVPSDSEENGEFPSRWDLESGSVEKAEIDGVIAITFLNKGTIVPYLEHSQDDYLSEKFTIEFDVYFKSVNSDKYWIYLWDKINQNKNDNSYFIIHRNQLNMFHSTMMYPGTTKSNWGEKSAWRHVSIAFTKGKIKAYLDDTQLINIPHYKANPSGITIEAETHISDFQCIKNIQIAKGGVKYYDRVLSEGKIIVNGIKFDINKATLKPESMGAINKIFKLMKKNTELNFSVEGHTDSDGETKYNQTLSVERVKTVMNILMDLGINSSRLTFAGFGESFPLESNATAEGRANNRRVEFVKF